MSICGLNKCLISSFVDNKVHGTIAESTFLKHFLLHARIFLSCPNRHFSKSISPSTVSRLRGRNKPPSRIHIVKIANFIMYDLFVIFLAFLPRQQNSGISYKYLQVADLNILRRPHKIVHTKINHQTELNHIPYSPVVECMSFRH